jgi:phosphotransferase system HPr (HPr) family protein
MVSKTLTVQNKHGIHARVALKVVEHCNTTSSHITVTKGNGKADGCSMIELLMLGAGNGAQINVAIDGGDEKKSLEKLEEIFSGGSGI